MVAQRAFSDRPVDLSDFRCPLSADASGRCGLFEAALAGETTICRYLQRVMTVDGFPASRCLLGTAKARRDHLA